MCYHSTLYFTLKTKRTAYLQEQSVQPVFYQLVFLFLKNRNTPGALNNKLPNTAFKSLQSSLEIPI